MGGKKKAGGGKKATKGGDDDEIKQDDLYEILKAKVDALKSRIFLEQERRDNAKVNEKEIRAAGAKLDEDMGKHKDTTRSHVKQMTKIYKSMEESNNE